MADALRRQLEQYDVPMKGPGENKPVKESPSVPSSSSSPSPSTTATTTTTTTTTTTSTSNLPKGVVLGPDGKPCRSCTSAAAWKNLMRQSKTGPSTNNPQSSPSPSPSPSTSSPLPNPPETQPADCPPDVEQLGRSSWTLLHTMAANYPDTATSGQQSDMRSFLQLFTKLYPCWVCGSGFQKWMVSHPPPLRERREFGEWMCQAHNVVNRRLGKGEFDCRFWERRWRDGWEDGRCD